VTQDGLRPPYDVDPDSKGEFMALTPEDVSNKRFTTVRLREGYDMTEVDQFLDEVESELTRMTHEHSELQAKLHAALTGEPMSVVEPTPRLEPAPELTPEPILAPTPEPTSQPGLPDTGAAEAPPVELGAVPEELPSRTAPLESFQVTTTAQASVAATRLLELAGSNADQLVAEATAQAEQIVGESRSRAEALEAEARSRAEALEAETEERRAQLFGDIEQEKSRLDTEINTLRAFEREYRAELKTYFEDQLAALEGQGTGGVLHSDRSEESGADQSDESQSDQPRLQAILNDES
jgi:DivIVA domain-containing protein